MIIVECFSDELLIRTMGFSKKNIKHRSGKSKIFDWMKERSNSIGIVDEDPRSTQPP